jgi:tripartite-type tricarboxylate transporter receptor subunit TctC
MKRYTISIAIVIAAALFVSRAHAQYYQGKQITMMVNYPAGGNADIEARIFQRHLARHIVSNPNIIVANRPGAGGMVGIKWLATANAPKDGTLFCYCTLNIVSSLVDPTLSFDYQDFAYIAGVRQWTAAYGRKDIPPGMNKPADLARAVDVYGAGYSPSNSHDMMIKLTLEMMGAKFRVISGLKSVGDVNISILHKETNFTLSTMPNFMSQTLPGIIREGVAMPMWYFPIIGSDGSVQRRNATLEALHILPFADVYREAHGRDPSGSNWEALVLLSNLSTVLLRAVVMPPGSPKSAVEEMRAAFAAVAQDKEFRNDYRRIISQEVEIISVEDGEAALASVPKIKPSMIELLTKFAQWN